MTGFELGTDGPGRAPGAHGSRPELAADVQGEARRYLDDLALTGELVARRHDPYTGIVRPADERRVDAVVVGASAKARALDRRFARRTARARREMARHRRSVA
ncbi:MAG: hypothetical protein K0S40_1459 [Actinomycetospora sp.]|nr:hypothetical protein [Actinomycetospora sp.]